MSFDTFGSRPSYLTNLDFTIGINRNGIRFGGGAGDADFARLVGRETGRVVVDLVTRPREKAGDASLPDGHSDRPRGAQVEAVIPVQESGAGLVADERDFEMPPQHVVDAKVINAEAGEGARAKDLQGIAGPQVALGAEGAFDPKVIVDPKFIQDPKVIADPKAIIPPPPPAAAAAEPVKLNTITKFPLVENGQLPAAETVSVYITGKASLLKSDGISDEQRRSACVDLYRLVMSKFDGTITEYIFLPDEELLRRLDVHGERASLADTILNMRNYISTIKFLCKNYLLWHEMADIEDMERVLDDLEEAMSPSQFADNAALRERFQPVLNRARETGRRLRDRVGEAGGAAGRVIRDAGGAAGRVIGEILRLFPPIPGLPGGDRRFGH